MVTVADGPLPGGAVLRGTGRILEYLGKPVSEVGWLRIWIAELGGEIQADCLLRSGFMNTTLHRCQFAIGVERPYIGGIMVCLGV